jgi:glycosyltransferase involved in cell wall biosynthesis
VYANDRPVERMRYLIYTETFPSLEAHDPRQTGIGRYCADIGAGLHELGHDVLVLTGDQSGGTATSGPDFEVETLGPLAPRAMEYWRRRRKVLRRINQIRPDYVLVGDPSGHEVMAAGYRVPGAPICPIFHGTELSTWGSAQRTPPRGIRRRLRRGALQRYLQHADALICNSRFTAKLLHELVPTPRHECVVYPSVNRRMVLRPADTQFREALCRRVARGGAAPTVLLTVARISERKNQLRVVEALAYLRQQVDDPIQYFIVGNVDADTHRRYFEEIQVMVRSAGLHDVVTVVHHTSDEEKISYLDACDVFVMLSRTVGDSVEGFGISVIEAACRGKPVVVSDQGGMPETAVDGSTGRVIPDDVAVLASVLLEMGRDPALRARWGEAGRRFALSEFTPAASAARLHQCLSSPTR